VPPPQGSSAQAWPGLCHCNGCFQAPRAHGSSHAFHALTPRIATAGIEGLRGLCHPKAVCEDRVPWLMSSSLPPPWQYPVQVRP